MGAVTETITKIIDDRDGMELPDNTVPIELSYKGWDYMLYLSKSNTELLESVIHEFTVNAEPLQLREAKKKSTRKPAEFPKGGVSQAIVREWANTKGLKVNDQGRIPNEIIRKYNAAH